jgi:hypothetical protein
MRCYHVKFILCADCGIIPHTMCFYASDPQDLAEQILEYEEDIEDNYIILSRSIKEVITRI